jgi:hypothetical protein
MSTAVATLQQSILREYAESVGLQPNVTYYGGTRLRPLVPLGA